MLSGKKLIKKLDDLTRRVLGDTKPHGIYDKVDKKDEILEDSPKADKLKAGIKARLSAWFGPNQLDRKLDDLP